MEPCQKNYNLTVGLDEVWIGLHILNTHLLQSILALICTFPYSEALALLRWKKREENESIVLLLKRISILDSICMRIVDKFETLSSREGNKSFLFAMLSAPRTHEESELFHSPNLFFNSSFMDASEFSYQFKSKSILKLFFLFQAGRIKRGFQISVLNVVSSRMEFYDTVTSSFFHLFAFWRDQVRLEWRIAWIIINWAPNSFARNKCFPIFWNSLSRQSLLTRP